MKRLLGIISLMSISILGSAQIDVHCHMITDSYLGPVKAHGMEMDEGFPIPSWSADAHLKLIDTNPMVTATLNKSAIR